MRVYNNTNLLPLEKDDYILHFSLSTYPYVMVNLHLP